MPSSPTVLITGASGFVGSIVSSEAGKRGYVVHGCARSSVKPSDFNGEWHSASWEEGAAPMIALINAIEPTMIIHAAGSASVANSLQSPLLDLEASLGTWSVLLEAVRLSEQKPVLVFPSSAAVYGDPKTLPVAEDSECKPVSPYGWHKLLCEGLAHAHAAAFDAQIVIARLFSVFGAHQRRLLTWELFDRLRTDVGPLKVMGSGNESRDFLGEESVASALIELAKFKATMPSSNEPLIVNVASGEEVTTLQMARHLTALIRPGRDIICCGEPRPGDPLRWRADITRLRTVLPNYRPQDFTESLVSAIAGWREHPSPRV